MFCLNNAEHKAGKLHREDNALEYKSGKYNKFSRISSVHEDGDYASGNVSISVVNLSHMIPFLFSGLTAGNTGLIPSNNAGTGVQLRYSIHIDTGHFHSLDNINNAGSGYAVGDLVWDVDPTNADLSIANATVIFKVTDVDASGGVTGIEYVSGGGYEMDGWYPGLTGNLGAYYSDESFYNNINSISISTFVDVIERIADARTENGAEQNRLNLVDDFLDRKITNLESAHGRMMDADMALESTRFARQNVLLQSSAAMVAQANQLSSIALTLLG